MVTGSIPKIYTSEGKPKKALITKDEKDKSTELIVYFNEQIKSPQTAIQKQ